MNFRSSHWRCSAKKGVLKNFAKFTGKHLCESLFFNKVGCLRSVQKTSGQLLLWTTASETSNTKYLELIKRRSKVQEKNMSCKHALNFD